MNPHGTHMAAHTHTRARAHTTSAGSRKWVVHGWLCVSVYMRVEGGAALWRYGAPRSCTVVFCYRARARACAVT